MAVMDTANKRRAIINMIAHHRVGLIPSGAVELIDVQNYGLIYPFLDYPTSGGGAGIPWIKRRRANLRRKLYG